jgi:uncharacterized protein (TIRG00374 family)
LKKRILKILEFTGFLAIGLLLLYFAFKGMSFRKMAEDLKTVNYFWIFVSLSFAFIAYFARAYRWKLIIEPLKYSPPLSSTFYALMTGYLANFAFPRIGELTRCVSLSKKEHIPVDKLFGTVILERIIDLLSLLVLLALLLIIKLEKFGSFLGDSIVRPLYNQFTEYIFSPVLWIIVVAMIISGIAGYYIFKERLSKFRILSRIKKVLHGVADGLKTVYQMKRRWEFLFFTCLIWFLYLMMTWVLVFSVPSLSHLNIIDGMFILVIGGLGMSAPVQGGIGAFHWIVSRGLATVYAISLEDGLVMATISHGSQALLTILVGSVSFFLILRKNKKKK